MLRILKNIIKKSSIYMYIMFNLPVCEYSSKITRWSLTFIFARQTPGEFIRLESRSTWDRERDLLHCILMVHMLISLVSTVQINLSLFQLLIVH